MRRIILALNTFALAVMTLAFTRCAAVQETDVPLRAKASFEVYASPSDTRTANDGIHTLWNNGDRFSLFHAPAGTPTFYADGPFTIDKPEVGHAMGTVSDLADGTYDWYMVYPYAEGADRPTNIPVLVGAPADGEQVQAGKDNRSHLAGEGFPLGGRGRNVTTPDTPVLTVAPLVSVVAVNVTNPGEGLARISSIRFKAPEAIVGGFRVDVTGDAPVFRADDASDEAVLSVTGTTLLRAGESGIFYLGIKPFTAHSGSTLTLTVNDQVRTVTLTRDVTFSAGMIKTLNITLDESEPSPLSYFKRTETVVSGHKYILVAEDTREGGLRMACPLPEDLKSGRLPVETVTETEEGVIALEVPDNAFVITQGERGYTIRQQDGRYLYNGGKDDVFAGTEPAASYFWSITFGDDGLANILNSGRHVQYNPSVQKFQARQTSSTVGQNPWLYELMNDGDLTDEFVQKTIPGVYGYNGFDWLYADGISQTSVRTLAGTTAFRIFYPEEFMVLQLTGIPAEPALNDRFPVRFVRYIKQAATHADDFTVTVVKVEDGKAWLMADGGTGFLVQIQ
ncbi:MAG: hypothetical protein IJ893_04190 [Bacteroidales bacterium]|nr:hypothetical protein [Bacteroidales bacterium]MBR3097025.1 hypothetical protein [Bacteroidales bacterium]